MSEFNTPNVPAGWYPDPLDPSIDRWWDGRAWGGTSRGRQLAAGWYPDPDTGRNRRWDGSRWGAYETDRKTKAPKRRIAQGGGVLKNPQGSRRWVKVSIAAMVLVLAAVAGVTYWHRGGTPSASIGNVAQVVNPAMGTMYGSTSGLLTVSHLPNGVTRYLCFDGTTMTNGPGQTLEDPCVGHSAKVVK